MSMRATSSQSKRTCSKCEKTAGSFSCDGCGQSFCLKHVTEHRQELNYQMDNIEQEHNIIHLELLNQKDKQNEHKIFNRIDQWEKESIEKIHQIADESRTTLKQILDSILDYGHKSLKKVSLKLHRARESDDFFENDLHRWMQQLNHLRAEIECMSNSISIINDHSTSVIHFIKIVQDQIVTTPDKDTSSWGSPFSWLSGAKTLFYDSSQKSLSTQTDAKNSIVIIKVNKTDHYIDIENSSWGENDENMTGWTLQRDVNNKSKIIYKFPDDFILKRQSHLRISFDTINDDESWNITYLIDANGEEKSSIIQNA